MFVSICVEVCVNYRRLYFDVHSRALVQYAFRHSLSHDTKCWVFAHLYPLLIFYIKLVFYLDCYGKFSVLATLGSVPNTTPGSNKSASGIRFPGLNDMADERDKKPVPKWVPISLVCVEQDIFVTGCSQKPTYLLLTSSSWHLQQSLLQSPWFS